jgi:hypothetical protein
MAACGVAQALLPVSNVWKAFVLVTGKSACATMPPPVPPCHRLCHHAAGQSPPRLMAMGKLPRTRPDDEPQRRRKCVAPALFSCAGVHTDVHL